MTNFEAENETWISLHNRAALLQAEDVSALLVTRSGSLGSLQCALFEQYESNASVDTFFRQTLEDMTIEAASTLPRLQPLTTPSQRRQQTSTDSRSQISSLDIDAFFEEYPECMKSNWDPIADIDSADDSDDDQPNVEYARPQEQAVCREAEPYLQKPLLAQQQNSNHQQPKSTPLPTATANPYSKIVNSDQNRRTTCEDPNEFQYTQEKLQQDSWTDASKSNTNRDSLPRRNPYDQTLQRNQSTSWENHESQQNPFQTAREFAQIGGQSKAHTAQPRLQDPSNHWDQSNDYRNENPYASEHRESSNTAPMHGGPSIPDSLKRKFQLPKKGHDSGKQNSKTSCPVPNRNGGGVQATRPSSSSSRTNMNNSRNSNSKNDSQDDEELPEELQHLDKELVKKIQNEIMESGDMVTFDDIAGLDDAKQTVQEVVCWPMKRPDLFTGLRRAPNGLLLYGPPGTGKTLIGKAIAYESGATFFSISSSSLTSKWIGEGEKLVRTLFAVAASREPAVVFIDEIDSLLTQRKASENEASRRIKTEFLVQLDGTGTTGQGRVLVIGATNRPQELDEAARRRFTKRLYIPLPSENDRRILLNVMLNKNNHRLTKEDVEKLAKETEGFSGADLKALCTDAAMGPIRQLGSKALSIEINDVPAISFKHFRRSLKGTRPSVAPTDLVQYEEWDMIYGSKRACEEDDDSSDDE
eukprot:scaffold5631_cov117-Cylindrotheca_fusiformis.AAC.1